MATALLNQVSNEFGGDTLNRIASAIGESPGKIKTALADLLPAMLGSLANKAQTREGANELLDVIHRDHLDTEQYGHVADAIKPPNAMGNLINTGEPLLDTVFEGKTGEVTDWVASHSGINHTSSKSLMSLSAPLVLGLLGRQVGGGGESGLMNLLGKPRSFLQDAPAGLASILGLGGMAAGATAAARSTAGGAAAAATDNARAARGGIEETTVRQHHYAREAPAPAHASPWRKWLWLALLLAALALLLGYFMQRRAPVSVEQPAAPAVTTPAVPPAPPAAAPEAPAPAAPPMPSAPEAAAPQAPAAPAVPPMAAAPEGGPLGGFIDQKLPDGQTIHIPANGVESKLIAYIEDPNQPISADKWFNFDRLEFQTGSATLAPSSQEQLNNVAAILKAYPQVNLKIGGYTDNTGNPQQNVQLSRARATNTMNQLVAGGIDPSRLTAEGFGDQFPVADNDTPEGRQRNRRIDMNVTKK